MSDKQLQNEQRQNESNQHAPDPALNRGATTGGTYGGPADEVPGTAPTNTTKSTVTGSRTTGLANDGLANDGLANDGLADDGSWDDRRAAHAWHGYDGRHVPLNRSRAGVRWRTKESPLVRFSFCGRAAAQEAPGVLDGDRTSTDPRRSIDWLSPVFPARDDERVNTETTGEHLAAPAERRAHEAKARSSAGSSSAICQAARAPPLRAPRTRGSPFCTGRTFATEL